MVDLFASSLQLWVALLWRIAVRRDKLSALRQCWCLLYAQGELAFGMSEACDKVID
jgi:hypothetical protein